jgi:hypothetical protein
MDLNELTWNSEANRDMPGPICINTLRHVLALSLIGILVSASSGRELLH